jgi:hypothetical protein
MAVYWRRKLTRLEAGLFAGVCAIIITVFLYKALALMEFAERAAMEVTVQHVNSGLRLRRAAELLEGGAVERAKALQTNPFELARVNVSNLHPDIADAKMLPALERRYWVFDRAGAELIYLPQLHRGLHTAAAEDVVRFRLVETRERGYLLVPASRYSWD